MEGSSCDYPSFVRKYFAVGSELSSAVAHCCNNMYMPSTLGFRKTLGKWRHPS